jgi:hypothetical protein
MQSVNQKVPISGRCAKGWAAHLPNAGRLRRASAKRSNSAPDFRGFDPHSQLEAAFRQNVWQSGAQNRMPKKRMSFRCNVNHQLVGKRGQRTRVACHGGTYQSLIAFPKNA